MAKILFLQNVWYEFLGVMQLSAILKYNGHTCDVILGSKKDIITKLKKINPDLIALSIMNVQREWAFKIAKSIKENGIKTPIILGGADPTLNPEIINNKYIDIICRGEGEGALLDLVDNLEKHKDITKIKNLWIKKDGKIYKNELRPLIENLDELPFPDRNLYNQYDFFRKKEATVFLAWRGCPFNCSFCFNHSFSKMYAEKGKFLRVRSPENIIKEIKEVDKNYKIKTVFFIDSTFNLNNEWVIKFLQKYKKEVKIPFTFNVRADLINEEIIKNIADTGLCVNIRFAIETGNEKLRKGVLNKQITNKQIIEAARLFKKYNLKVVVFNMFGIPGETIEDALETIKINSKVKPFVSSNLIFMPYPNLDITNFALEKGYVNKKDFKKLSIGKYKIYRSVLKQKDINQVSNLHKFSVIAIKFPFLLPIIKKLIILPQNKIFDHLYSLSQAWEWKKWENVSFLRFAQEIMKNYKEFS